MSDFIQIVDRQGRILALMDRRVHYSIGRSPTYDMLVGPPVPAYWSPGVCADDDWFAHRVTFQCKRRPVYGETGGLRERIEWLIPLCKLPKEFYKLPGVIDARTMFKS